MVFISYSLLLQGSYASVKPTCAPHTRPLGQGLQNEISVTPVSGLNVPAGHG